MKTRLALPLAALVALLAITRAGPARAEAVDLALVLAVDVSGSIDGERFAIQRNGYAAAFGNPSVIDAIASGAHGAIAVTLLEWSGPGHQQQVVGWTLINDRASAAAFGNAIARVERVYSDWTSISGAIDASVGLLRNSGFEATRRVIDISGDGPNNSGRPIADARNDALAAGITINGLPITTTEPDLDAYYRESVVGGDGAFTIVVQNFDSFASGILNKLVREIADAAPRRQLAMRWAPGEP
ncbi:MAG TPA: DUF1194 domain-containing protein [Stellaceae bacterium]|nr:DUF1194 domain-containing protein [Stellaceae bacterium]